MADIITTDDLPAGMRSAEMVALMVEAANAKASRIAPCLTWDGSESDEPAPTDEQLAEARLVLVGMVRRWVEAGSGAVVTEVAGPFQTTLDTRQRSGYHPWPSEIQALQDICASNDSATRAFSFQPSGRSSHMPWCALAFGATYCSCASDLTGYEYPLYEGGLLTEDCL